jgi:hypothetical protein
MAHRWNSDPGESDARRPDEFRGRAEGEDEFDEVTEDIDDCNDDQDQEGQEDEEPAF